jgi:hypothetical protein
LASTTPKVAARPAMAAAEVVLATLAPEVAARASAWVVATGQVAAAVESAAGTEEKAIRAKKTETGSTTITEAEQVYS